MVESIKLGEFEKTKKETDTEKVIVTRGTYAKNPEHVDIRCYYDANKGVGEEDYRPGKNGVRFDVENTAKLIKALGMVYGDEFFKELHNLMDKYNIE